MVYSDKAEIKKQIIDIIVAKLRVTASAVESAQTFQELGADSLDMVELIMQLEEHFSIEINDHDAESLSNIDAVVNYVQERTKK